MDGRKWQKAQAYYQATSPGHQQQHEQLLRPSPMEGIQQAQVVQSTIWWTARMVAGAVAGSRIHRQAPFCIKNPTGNDPSEIGLNNKEIAWCFQAPQEASKESRHDRDILKNAPAHLQRQLSACPGRQPHQQTCFQHTLSACP